MFFFSVLKWEKYVLRKKAVAVNDVNNRRSKNDNESRLFCVEEEDGEWQNEDDSDHKTVSPSPTGSTTLSNQRSMMTKRRARDRGQERILKTGAYPGEDAGDCSPSSSWGLIERKTCIN